MSTTPSASRTPGGSAYEILRPRKRTFPLVRLVFVILLFSTVSIFEPHCFRFAVKHLIQFEGWRCGVTTRVRAVEGSLFETVRVLDSIWIYESKNGPVTRLEIKELEADLSWRSLVRRSSTPWFATLRIDGLTGKVHLPIDSPAVDSPRRFEIPRPRGRWLTAPERFEAADVDFIFESDGDFVRLEKARFTISEMEPGEVMVGHLMIKQPWLNRTFRNVRGTTKLDGSRTEIGTVTLEPGVDIQNLSVELAEIVRGRLNLVLQVAAFGGDIRIETQMLPRDRQLAFEATSTFSQIGIGKLATFLGQSEAAGGTIKSGKFTFRGSPQSPAKATASLRIEATNFQWESRQWDSLVLGASLLDGRVQIPDLTLYQGENFFNLRGEFALPAPEQQWWQSKFAFDVNAKIENLTEISALVLPEFKFAAGKATIDGSVRGEQQQFHGQIIVSGSDLTWRSAPIEELHATLKLNGNELQLTNLSMFNDGDYVRGRGVVNILGDKQYWGELRASIEELGLYSALLQKPIVPEPIAGGGVIEWSGEGSAKGHTGKFLARLRKVRSLGASSAMLHPINADLGGSYQPGAILFSRFALSDDSSSFTANVSVADKALSVQEIRFTHGTDVQLEGGALLPLDVWQAWPNTNLATLLNDSTAAKVHLAAKAFDLRAASQLTGWNFPVEGRASGEISIEGPIGAIQGSGAVKLSNGVIPIGWSGMLLKDATAEISLAGAKIAVANFSARHPGGDVRINGEVDCTDVRNPKLALALVSTRSEWRPFSTPSVAAVALTLGIRGPADAPTVGGEMKPVSLKVAAPLDLAPVLLGPAPGRLPSILDLPDGPWSGWRLDVACRTAESISLGDGAGAVSVDLRLTGSVADPAPVGQVRVVSLPATIAGTPVRIEEAVLEFRAGAPADPSLTLRSTGSLFGESFAAHAAGPLSALLRNVSCELPLTGEVLREQLERTVFQPEVSLLAPVAQAVGREVYPWAPIEGAPEFGEAVQ